MKKNRLILSFIMLILVFLTGCLGVKDDDTVINVSSDDKEMNTAIEEARESLSHYWSVFDNPEEGESDFALKVKIEDGNGSSEHFWVVDIYKENGKIYGAISNEPQLVNNVEFGEKIEIIEDNISDWSYFKDNKMYGAFTTRVLLKYLSDEEAQEIKDMLSEKPF